MKKQKQKILSKTNLYICDEFIFEKTFLDDDLKNMCKKFIEDC